MYPFFSQIKDTLDNLLTFLTGEKCYICKVHGGFVCKECVSKLPYIKGNKCKICLAPIGGEGVNKDPICGECIKNPPYFKKVISTFWYEDSIKDIMHDIKFHQKYFYVSKIFSLIKTNVTNYFSNLGKIDFIVPIPLSKKRKIERGYNQSLLIAKELSKITKIPVLNNFLIKNKDLPPIMTMSREERFKNIKGTFSVAKKNSIDTIVLVDDIITTTATIREASKTLKKGGCNEIYVFTICRTKS